MDMERLTARNENGRAYLVNMKPYEQEADIPRKIERIISMLKCILDCFERLAQYEDEAIARQSVKSEEVAEAVAELSEKDYNEQNYCASYVSESTRKLAIAALQEYQPRVEGKATDHINCCPNCGWRWRQQYET